MRSNVQKRSGARPGQERDAEDAGRDGMDKTGYASTDGMRGRRCAWAKVRAAFKERRRGGERKGQASRGGPVCVRGRAEPCEGGGAM
jgi:hypothetical protein